MVTYFTVPTPPPRSLPPVYKSRQIWAQDRTYAQAGLYTGFVYWWWEIFYFGAFSRSPSARGGNIGCFSASEASAIYFIGGVFTRDHIRDIILTILKMRTCYCKIVEHWTPNSLSSQKGAPCCWELILMFDTCPAGIPLSPTHVWPAALYRRCTKTG